MSTSRKLRDRSAADQNDQTLLSSYSSSQQRHQKAFTELDETKILKTYLKILSESSKPTTKEISTESLNAIEASLSTRFCHSQIVEKLRRLRLTFHRHERSRSLIKTPHDQRLFSIARKIWGKRQKISMTLELQREEAKEEEFAAVREELRLALPGNRVWQEGLGRLDKEEVRDLNKKWVLLRMEEAELMARKAELVNELIHLVVDALGYS